ncbi:hypothetical protein ACX93W_01860 [Paenibacillus sp. CAU 1782]
MSKLDDNNRWSGKMLLTEHAEQYDAMKSEVPTVGRPTLDELTMIRDAVMYPYIITMLQNGIDNVTASRLPLKSLLERCLEVLMNSVSDNKFALNRELRKRNIKVHNEEAGDGILYFRYTCRGYNERFGIAREALRNEMSTRLTQYVDDVGKQLRNNSRH